MEGRIKSLIIDREALSDPLVSRIRERLPDAEATVVDRVGHCQMLGAGPPGSLVLMRRRGAFVKDFPVTCDSPPCGEKYIVTMLNCPHRCTYCYLQSYLSHERLVIFTDTDRMREEVAGTIADEAPRRMTTGEMGDSLALDELTGTTLELLPLFAGTGTLLEVRTKSAHVDHLLERPAGAPQPRPRDSGDPAEGGGTASQRPAGAEDLVVTWTLGPHEMVEREEPGTASLAGRLSAMHRTIGAGVKVGVRFDPIVPFYADPAAYDELIAGMKHAADGGAIHRFELGVLRFPPGLLEKMRTRHPASPLLRGEYVRDTEGKLRLYRPARVALYRKIARLIRSHFPDAVIELSMESGSVWEDAGIGRSFSC
jgi:spore photoproduct lyase